MSKIIAVANQKGGVAKTTTTQNLAVALAKRGKKVLMVDIDSQASLTIAVGLEPEEYADNCIVQVLSDPKKDKGYRPIEECIVPTPDGHAWIVPSIIDLANIEWQLFARMDRNKVLARPLEPIKESFDYILLDCPPALGIMTINAFSCADGVIVPSTTEYLSYRGLANLEQSIEEVKEVINPNVKIYGVIATKHERKTKSRQILELMMQNYPVIAVIKSLAEAIAGIYDGKSVVELLPGSDISKAYEATAEMIVKDSFITLDSWSWTTTEDEKA